MSDADEDTEDYHQLLDNFARRTGAAAQAVFVLCQMILSLATFTVLFILCKSRTFCDMTLRVKTNLIGIAVYAPVSGAICLHFLLKDPAYDGISPADWTWPWVREIGRKVWICLQW